jgi:hypothetical protein
MARTGADGAANQASGDSRALPFPYVAVRVYEGREPESS